VARDGVRPAREVSRDTGRVTAEAGRRPDGPTTAAIPGMRPSRKPGVPGVDPAPATGPIPVVRSRETDVLDEPLGAREGALAWLRFAGELVLALAAGVGIYFLSTVVWEQVPRVAVVLAPLAVATRRAPAPRERIADRVRLLRAPHWSREERLMQLFTLVVKR